jgi:membrane-associated protease RseP (regulator of RpoE activity)
MNSPPDKPFISTYDTGSPASSGVALEGELLPPAPMPTLDQYDLGMPRRRRVIPLVLFLATCFFTYAAGTYHWIPLFFGQHFSPLRGEYWDWSRTFRDLSSNWHDGLIYMVCVMGVLLAHEMGHFLMTVRYRIPASYPIFIPVPMMFIGTMGAVIGMQGFRANRRQMFDIGIAGPLAGLVVALPLIYFGILMAKVAPPVGLGEQVGDPLLMKILVPILRPELPHGAELLLNPVLMAGWVGIFITGLNMMPVSQLDGGHVIYGLFRRGSFVIARAFLLSAIAFVIITREFGWTLMIVLIMAIGVEHPPTSDDRVPLGFGRTILGLLSLVIPVLCFTPYPLYFG